jgi:hypothetical protein
LAIELWSKFGFDHWMPKLEIFNLVIELLKQFTFDHPAVLQGSFADVAVT